MAKGERHDLGQREEAVIEALLATRTVRDASERCGLGETTIRRYMKRGSFLEKYNERRGKITTTLVNRLQCASHQALDVLIEIISDDTVKENIKVTACKAILDTAVRSFEINKLMEIEKRLEEIENRGVGRAIS